MSPSPVGDRQRPWARSQMVVWGQQCTLSAQHEACRHRTHSSQLWLHDVPPKCPRIILPSPPYLGHGAAPPGAIRCHAAGGIIGTLGLSVGTRDSTRGCGEWEWGEGPPYPLSSPHQAHPRAAPPIPRDVMQELPSALQRDPRGQQWRPPAQGTPWGERRGGGRAAGGGKAPPPPPNGRERGGETEAH